MNRPRRRNVYFASACLSALIGLNLVFGRQGYDRTTGYVPQGLENFSTWSDSRLQRELDLIVHFAGDYRGDANYTLSQRKAYNVLTSELSRREIDK